MNPQEGTSSRKNAAYTNDQLWAQYRKAFGPPPWVSVCLVVLTIVGMFALASWLWDYPQKALKAARGGAGVFIVPISMVLSFVYSILKRRERVLRQIIQEQAPELYAKIQEKNIV